MHIYVYIILDLSYHPICMTSQETYITTTKQNGLYTVDSNELEPPEDFTESSNN